METLNSNSLDSVTPVKRESIKSKSLKHLKKEAHKTVKFRNDCIRAKRRISE